VKADPDQARYWFRRAADANHKGAKKALEKLGG
jgi:TPR repeat protein